MVMPVSAMLSMIASLGTPFFTGPVVPLNLRTKKSTGHLLLSALPPTFPALRGRRQANHNGRQPNG
jgi:hypothetical protein